MKKLTYLLLCLVLGIGLATAQTRKVLLFPPKTVNRLLVRL